MRRLIRPRAAQQLVTVREPHPMSVLMAAALGQLHGAGINGHAGTVVWGAERAGSQANKGYLYSPYTFLGWSPRHRAGTIQGSVTQLPATSAPWGYANPVDAALITVSRGQGVVYGD